MNLRILRGTRLVVAAVIVSAISAPPATAATYTYSPFGPNLIRTPPPGSNPEGYRYPRAIQLHHQSGAQAGANGAMLGTLQWLAGTGQTPNIAIFRSNDEGRSWGNPIATVQDTMHGSETHLTSQPHLYELPSAIGTMPAGTVLLAALARQPSGGDTYIMLYRSNDAGVTWSPVSVVAQGGAPQEGADPIWEPFVVVLNDRLVVFYSDERDPAHSQKLVHQTSANGTTWGPVVDDVADPDPAGRPGMPVVARMNNGQYILTYEHCGNHGCRVEYRVSANPESWASATEQVLSLPDGTTPCCTPYVQNLPGTGPAGAIVVSGRDSSFYVNYADAAPGSRWIRMAAKVAGGWSRSMVAMDDGQSLFITSTPIQSDGFSRWYTANQYFGDRTDITTGRWYLVNRASGDRLEVANAGTADGAFVSEFPANGCDCQKWRFADAGGGYYKIANVLSGKVLEVRNGAVDDNRAIQQFTDNGSAGQQWRVRQLDLTSGLIKLYNRNSGKTFDSAGSTDAQPAETQVADTGLQRQEWTLVPAP